MNRIVILVIVTSFFHSHIERAIAAEAATSDQFVQVRGFRVEISGEDGKDADMAWETVTGGELIIELTDTTTENDKYHPTSPRHRSVGELTLRGCLSGRCTIPRWIRNCLDGKSCSRNLIIRPFVISKEREAQYLATLKFENCTLSQASLIFHARTPYGAGSQTLLLQCALQESSQTESFNTLTNIAKSKHDAAIAAIQNTR